MSFYAYCQSENDTAKGFHKDRAYSTWAQLTQDLLEQLQDRVQAGLNSRLLNELNSENLKKYISTTIHPEQSLNQYKRQIFNIPKDIFNISQIAYQVKQNMERAMLRDPIRQIQYLKTRIKKIAHFNAQQKIISQLNYILTKI